MDPVSLALAILPLALTAIKGYRMLHERMDVFCHYSREIGRLRKRLDRQQKFFNNELHLLIQIVVKDDRTVEDMMRNVRHEKWQCEELETSLRSLLGSSYDTCLEVIEEIASTIQELQHEMDCFNEIESHRQNDEPIKHTLRRLRNSLKITWDQSKFESSYTYLRNCSDDLGRLRKQACEIKQSKMPAWDIRKQLSPEHGSYSTISKASKALHCAFANSWSDGPVASKHSVKMFIDATLEEQVCMDVAVLCYGHDSAAINLLRPDLRMLKVRSQTMDWIECRVQSPPQDSNDGRKKRQKVRFTDDCTSSKQRKIPAQLPSPDSPASQSTISECLIQTDICSALAAERSRLFAFSLPRYLGYLENSSTDNFRHSIYHGAKSKGLEPRKLIYMSQIFERSIHSALTVVDQLKLARNMVVAVLKFHSTPWLGQYFGADDFHFFEADTDLSSSLQTLHFSVDHYSKGCRGLSESYMQGIDIPDASQDLIEEVENASIQFGIRNITLWSLGAILLQIGRWSKINSPDDVITVRKLSSQVPPLGPRYQQLTKKCLDCDFSYGDDLAKPRLQQAIYENLVCELTEMIEGLSIREAVY